MRDGLDGGPSGASWCFHTRGWQRPRLSRSSREEHLGRDASGGRGTNEVKGGMTQAKDRSTGADPSGSGPPNRREGPRSPNISEDGDISGVIDACRALPVKWQRQAERRWADARTRWAKDWPNILQVQAL